MSLTETLDSLSPNQTTDAGTLQFPIGMNESHHFTAHYGRVLLRRILQGYLLAPRRKPRLLLLPPLLVFLNTLELVKAQSNVDGRARTNYPLICWTTCLFLTVNKSRGKPNTRQTVASASDASASQSMIPLARSVPRSPALSTRTAVGRFAFIAHANPH